MSTADTILSEWKKLGTYVNIETPIKKPSKRNQSIKTVKDEDFRVIKNEKKEKFTSGDFYMPVPITGLQKYGMYSGLYNFMSSYNNIEKQQIDKQYKYILLYVKSIGKEQINLKFDEKDTPSITQAFHGDIKPEKIVQEWTNEYLEDFKRNKPIPVYDPLQKDNKLNGKLWEEEVVKTRKSPSNTKQNLPQIEHSLQTFSNNPILNKGDIFHVPINNLTRQNQHDQLPQIIASLNIQCIPRSYKWIRMHVFSFTQKEINLRVKKDFKQKPYISFKKDEVPWEKWIKDFNEDLNKNTNVFDPENFTINENDCKKVDKTVQPYNDGESCERGDFKTVTLNVRTYDNIDILKCFPNMRSNWRNIHKLRKFMLLVDTMHDFGKDPEHKGYVEAIMRKKIQEIKRKIEETKETNEIKKLNTELKELTEIVELANKTTDNNITNTICDITQTSRANFAIDDISGVAVDFVNQYANQFEAGIEKIKKDRANTPFMKIYTGQHIRGKENGIFDDKSKFMKIVNTFFGEEYKVVINTSTVSEEYFGKDNILTTTANVYDQKQNKDKTLVLSDNSYGIFRTQGELYSLHSLSVDKCNIQMRVDKKHGNHLETVTKSFNVNTNAQFTKGDIKFQCLPITVDNIKMARKNYRELFKQCFDVDVHHELALYDLKLAGDALVMKSAMHFNAIFVTKDKPAFYNAVFHGCNSIYYNDHHLYMFRASAPFKAIDGSYKPNYNINEPEVKQVTPSIDLSIMLKLQERFSKTPSNIGSYNMNDAIAMFQLLKVVMIRCMNLKMKLDCFENIMNDPQFEMIPENKHDTQVYQEISKEFTEYKTFLGRLNNIASDKDLLDYIFNFTDNNLSIKLREAWKNLTYAQKTSAPFNSVTPAVTSLFETVPMGAFGHLKTLFSNAFNRQRTGGNIEKIMKTWKKSGGGQEVANEMQEMFNWSILFMNCYDKDNKTNLLDTYINMLLEASIRSACSYDNIATYADFKNSWYSKIHEYVDSHYVTHYGIHDASDATLKMFMYHIEHHNQVDDDESFKIQKRPRSVSNVSSPQVYKMTKRSSSQLQVLPFTSQKSNRSASNAPGTPQMQSP